MDLGEVVEVEKYMDKEALMEETVEILLLRQKTVQTQLDGPTLGKN